MLFIEQLHQYMNTREKREQLDKEASNKISVSKRKVSNILLKLTVNQISRVWIRLCEINERSAP